MQHRLKATTRHGLHSPFVYRLVDKVVYDRTPKMLCADIENCPKELPNSVNSYSNPAKVDQLIYRLVADMNPENRVSLGAISPVTERYLLKAAPEAKIYSTLKDLVEQIDLVVINSVEKEEINTDFNSCISVVHQDSMVVVNGIYRNKQTEEAWEAIKAHIQVTVTVDLFWVGLVFFRVGKVKEDFWIRF